MSKAAPLVDITFTTSHVGRLYMSDGLFEKLDMAKIPNARDLAREAIRSDRHLGVWAYVYTIAYRPDLLRTEIKRWADLWDPQLKSKLGLPDFDPSHIITIAALLEGGNEKDWQKGQARLKRLKPNVAAFFSTDARSQDLMKTGEAPVQVMLSINGFHLIDQGLNVKVITPADRPGIVGAHFCQADVAATQVKTEEKKLLGRADALARWVLLVEGLDRDAVEGVCRDFLSAETLTRHGAAPDIAAAVYRLTYSLER